MRKLISIVLCLALILGSASSVFADTSQGTATTLRLEKTEGKVDITKAGGKSVTVKDGTRLYDGYEIKTGTKSAAYVSLDSTKAIMLDASTDVSIKKSGKKLEIMLKAGTILVNVEDKLAGDEEMNIRTTNSVTGIRGTIIQATFIPKTQNTEIYLFEGKTTGMYLAPDGSWYRQTLTTGSWLASGRGMLADNPEYNGWTLGSGGEWIYTNNKIEGTMFQQWCWSAERGWYTYDTQTGTVSKQEAWPFTFKDLQPKVQSEILNTPSMLTRGQQHLDLYPELAENKVTATRETAETALAQQQDETQKKDDAIQEAFEKGNGGNTVDNLFEDTGSTEPSVPTYPMVYLMDDPAVVADAETYTTQNYEQGASVTAPADPTKPGYTFAGWSDALPTSKSTETETVYATWAENSYSISFDGNNGTFAETPEDMTGVMYTARPNVTELEPELPGYTFRGWSTDAVTPGSSIAGITIIGAGQPIPDALSTDNDVTVTLYAVWEPNDYNVTLNTDGGTINAGNVTTYTYGVGAVLPTDVTKANYTFDGWTTPDAVTTVTEITATDIGDKTFVARWTPVDYAVTLVTNGGTINSGNVTGYTYGVGAVLPDEADITKTGYYFDGWYDNAELEGEISESIIETDSGDKTFYAKWTPETYAVELAPDGGTINTGNVTEYTYGVGAILPTDVTRANYSFDGWFEGDADTPTTEITTTDLGDKSYTAHWTPDSYRVTLNADGGTVNAGNVTAYTYGIGATLPTDVTKANYDFAGWFDNEALAGTAVTTISTTDTGNKTFYAKWTPKTYTISYQPNGGAGNLFPQEFVYDDASSSAALTNPADVTLSGYTGIGWASTATATAAEFTKEDTTYAKQDALAALADDTDTITLYVVWEANTYNVTLNQSEDVIIADGKNVENYTYGVGATLPTAADMTYKTGYEFKGWYVSEDLSGTAVTEISTTDIDDKTFYAKWSPIAVTVTLTDNTSSTVTAYNGEATVPADSHVGNVYTYTADFDSTLSIMLTDAPSTDTIYKIVDANGNYYAINRDNLTFDVPITVETGIALTITDIYDYDLDESPTTTFATEIYNDFDSEYTYNTEYAEIVSFRGNIVSYGVSDGEYSFDVEGDGGITIDIQGKLNGKQYGVNEIVYVESSEPNPTPDSFDFETFTWTYTLTETYSTIRVSPVYGVVIDGDASAFNVTNAIYSQSDTDTYYFANASIQFTTPADANNELLVLRTFSGTTDPYNDYNLAGGTFSLPADTANAYHIYYRDGGIALISVTYPSEDAYTVNSSVIASIPGGTGYSYTNYVVPIGSTFSFTAASERAAKLVESEGDEELIGPDTGNNYSVTVEGASMFIEVFLYPAHPTGTKLVYIDDSFADSLAAGYGITSTTGLTATGYDGYYYASEGDTITINARIPSSYTVGSSTYGFLTAQSDEASFTDKEVREDGTDRTFTYNAVIAEDSSIYLVPTPLENVALVTINNPDTANIYLQVSSDMLAQDGSLEGTYNIYVPYEYYGSDMKFALMNAADDTINANYNAQAFPINDPAIVVDITRNDDGSFTINKLDLSDNSLASGKGGISVSFDLIP